MRIRQVASGTAAVSGDNTILAKPGNGYRYLILGYKIQNESAVATTSILYDGPSGDSIELDRFLGQAQADWFDSTFPDESPLYLREDSALVLNLSGANSHGYTIWYRIVTTP